MTAASSRGPSAGTGNWPQLERLHLRGVVVVALIVLAYHYSLITLGRGLALQTPLAFLAAVPLIALVLAFMTMRRTTLVRSINDRQVDYIIGFGLVAGAAVIVLLSPASLGSAFWTYRVDLLSLPLFVAGLVSIFFGVRRAWLLRWPIAFLVLAWPVPYLPFLGEGMRASVELTVTAVSALGSVLPWATQVSAANPGTFLISNDAGPFVMSVTAACSGINSVVGFGLIAVAVAAVLRGSVWHKLAWIGAGLATVFLINVIRIEAIFGVGAILGPDAALGVLHPIAGLVAFNIALLVMIALVGRFGLSVSDPAPPTATAAPAPSSHVGQIRGALAVGVAVAVAFGVVNATYGRFDGGAGSLAPRASATGLAAMAGWDVMPVGDLNATDLFGSGSSWSRLRYTSTPMARYWSSLPLYVDTISTADATVLAAYGVGAIYPFAGYDVVADFTDELTPGIEATVMTYRHPETGRIWTLATWVDPPRGDGSFDRRTIILPDSDQAELLGPLPVDVSVTGDQRALAERFLVGLARAMVAP